MSSALPSLMRRRIQTTEIIVLPMTSLQPALFSRGRSEIVKLYSAITILIFSSSRLSLLQLITIASSKFYWPHQQDGLLPPAADAAANFATYLSDTMIALQPLQRAQYFI